MQTVVPQIDLNDTDLAILEEIDENGRATTRLLSDVVGVSRTYAGDRVRRLLEHEYLEEVAPNLYDLTDKGKREFRKEREDGEEDA